MSAFRLNWKLLTRKRGSSTQGKDLAGRYRHRLVPGGIGHNLPQEAPQAFADAVLEAAGA